MQSIEVIKIGGSLLTRADFVPAMRRLLHEHSDSGETLHRVFIVGGGALVETLRQLDAAAPQDELQTHWQAIDLMDITGRWVAEHLQELTLVQQYDQLVDRCGHPGQSLFLASHFLRHVEPKLPGERLGQGWCVTSDSVAARIAHALGAVRLRLYKSRAATSDELSCWTVASQQGLVDESFPQVAQGIASIECCTLNSA